MGYAVRFEERRSPDTQITYLTGAQPRRSCGSSSSALHGSVQMPANAQAAELGCAQLLCPTASQ